MRKKLFDILNKIYGIVMSVSFFAGLLPLFGFVAALFIGGETARKICVFLCDSYYPWVIALGSTAVVVGLIGMYVGKIQGLSMKKISTDESGK